MSNKGWVSRSWLLTEYDRQHEGPAGRARKLIEDAPPADVKPVVRGKWIDMGDFVQCSACKGTNLKKVKTYYGEVIWVKSDFCPNCGADMRENSDER